MSKRNPIRRISTWAADGSPKMLADLILHSWRHISPSENIIGTNKSSCYESPRWCFAKEISTFSWNKIRISQEVRAQSVYLWANSLRSWRNCICARSKRLLPILCAASSPLPSQNFARERSRRLRRLLGQSIFDFKLKIQNQNFFENHWSIFSDFRFSALFSLRKMWRWKLSFFFRKFNFQFFFFSFLLCRLKVEIKVFWTFDFNLES